MMQFIIHQEHGTNFVNNEGGKSAKNRVGHKAGSLSQRVVLNINHDKINRHLKTKIEAEIISKRHFIRKGRATIFVNSVKYSLNCKDARQFSNDIVNLLLMDRFNNKINISQQTIKK